ncbi:graves disease carrier protein homolog [Thrips palmi]|uniref:Graves disease carrier protein homolog n=1 Tax=Thrips palmi TaxID=161013 RepID=A0A6P9A768_THRPL|nr:graves disease carrier protein homolog [Thrips palmi]
MTTMFSDQTTEKLKTLLSGGVAGMCSKTTVAPLDRMKILFQAHNNHYKNLGVWSGLKAIVKNENIFALYKGNGAQMVRIFPYAAIQFTAYSTYKRTFSSMCETSTWLGSFLTNFGSGALAGVTAVAMTYPLDTIRARLSFQVKGEHKYKGIVHAGVTIVRNEGGVLALYRGFVPTLCGIFPQAGCNFYFFEQLKNMCMQYFPMYTCNVCEQNTGGLVLSIPAKLACGGVAGAIAQTFSYPLDVTRRRMQLAMMTPETSKFATGMLSTLKMTYQENGIVRGLYRGMSINFYRVCPMCAVSFSTNEMVKQLLGLDTGV